MANDATARPDDADSLTRHRRRVAAMAELVPFSPSVTANKWTASKTQLDLADNLDFDEWCTLGTELARVEKGVQWWIGNCWAFGKHRYGQRAKAAAQGIFGRKFQTLANTASVARSFETSRRREALDFTDHAEVAALPAPEADALLDTAEAENWSTRQLRAEVSRRKVTVGVQPSASTGRVEDLHKLVASGYRAGCIYADPPWLYDNQGTRAATSKHYHGMTVDQLCALPVRDLALPDAHLHLWRPVR